MEATLELQDEYQHANVIVNPPVSVTERDVYEEDGPAHTYRRVETIEFDVAVTATSESAGGGKAGLRILSVEAGFDGKHSKTSEQASRVKFNIPITLTPSVAEAKNKEVSEQRREASKQASDKQRARMRTGIA